MPERSGCEVGDVGVGRHSLDVLDVLALRSQPVLSRYEATLVPFRSKSPVRPASPPPPRLEFPEGTKESQRAGASDDWA